MNDRVYSKYKRNLAYRMTVFGVLAGLIYALLSDGYQALMPITNGIFAGAILGAFASYFELYFLNPQRRRKLTFMKMLLLRVAVYSFVIVAVLFFVFSFSRAIWNGVSYLSVLKSEEFQKYLLQEDFITVVFYTIGLALLLTFAIQVSRKLGQGYLFNVISGRYFRPKVRERTFLFVNLLNIREIIEANGHQKSFEFVNDFLYQSTQAILYHKAKIHHYVDNQMVLFWDDSRSIEQAIRCFFALQNQTDQRSNYYRSHYGIIPEINGGVHAGSIVQAEIGSAKTEIAFYGDVINTTARIASVAHSNGSVLCDAALLKQTAIDGEFIGDIQLIGKKATIQLKKVKHAS